ncbi:MAG TPA: calcium-binding protein, partial [Tepidisphaeraceae bacterium]|nr:calcium-binding protein [Tepidisphaeraceae bacterium]
GTVFSANNLMLFRDNDSKLWRSNGTVEGTYQLSPDNMSVTTRIFTSGDFIYFEGKVGNLTSLYRTNGVSANLQTIATDFSLSDTSHAELSGWTYFSGGFYNTANNGAHGLELYRVRNSDGALELAAEVSESGSSYPTNIGIVADNIYFIARDGEFVQSQGTYDVELYRFNPKTNELKLVTTNNQLYPIGLGGGSLASYYFVSAPTKDDARWGSRSLYRTNPITDMVEEVEGVPDATNSNGQIYQNVRGTSVNSKGFFFWADSGVMGREQDMFFVTTPFSNLREDGTLLIDATKSSDTLSIKMDNGDLVLKLNGREERWDASEVSQINIALGAGDDKLVTDQSVVKRMYVFGDVGNDTITTGAGRDTITGGGGSNRMFGGDGDDRITGSNGRDIADGQGGSDRIYGNGGADDLSGGAGVDRVWGGDGDDILRGGSSNDKLYGEAGNDTLAGGSQNDWLVGGDGNDDLFGNIGIDSLTGGAGTDRRENDSTDQLLDVIEAIKA